ncbi:YihY/virulence factor BrkB family protein [Halalkalibacter urbisdiaboli]|uniref:YihY/virulence factor BrkB family protein n=1 Tax=Halalkalibacter urbisdiaboli TaxID=1960589 RepID=UPI000B440CFF|nr:YihY/virulence factor BrkB family protein [Halalkalibacter urbisdiaboli]
MTYFIKELIHHLKTDPILDWAATLAYYFMLSIFPFMIFIIALIPYFHLDVGQVQAFILDYVPEELAELFTTTIIEVISEPKGGLLSFGILATIWAASNGLNALIRAVNRSYKIEETRNFFLLRLVSMMMTIGMILVIVVTLLLPVFGDIIIHTIEGLLFITPETIDLLHKLRWIVGIGMMTFFLMLLYLIAPNVKLKLKQVIIGAITATVGWQIISFVFSTYVSNFGNFTATYGSLGGVIILMLWFFLTGLMLVIGGEINAILYHQKQQQNR